MTLCFKNILVSLDGLPGDSHVVTRAFELADEYQSQLTFIRVVDIVPEQVGWLAEGAPPPIDLEQAHIDQAKYQLNSLLERYNQSHIPVKTLVKVGRTSIEVIKTAIHNHHDLIIRAGDQSKGLMAALFGHTCKHLFHKSPVPVLGIKPVKDHQYKRILATIAVPGDSHSTLNDMILDTAKAMADREQAELMILHTWRPQVVPEGIRWSKDVNQQIDQWLEQSQQRHRSWFKKQVARVGYSIDDPRILFQEGDPGHLIPLIVEENDIDLVVMGTHSYSGIKGLLMGNTAERVINAIHCSVLALKPEGFISPVAD